MKKSKDYYYTSFEKVIRLIIRIRNRLILYFYEYMGFVFIKWLNHSIGIQVKNLSLGNMLQSKFYIPEEIQIDKFERDRILYSAELTMNSCYDILGSGIVKIDPMDWHTDFKTGYHWPPGTFFRNYLQEDLQNTADVKIPRELSRSHHLLRLGLAYKLTNDEKYADMCLEQMSDWIESNPLMFSINWGCTMDVGIRAVNWIWTLRIISEYLRQKNELLNKLMISLFQHGWFIWRNPEKDLRYSGNHYLANLAGQIHLGLLFNELEEPKLWLERGKHELFHEIRIQILPSGMSYERSTNYNRLVLELILVPLLLLKNKGHEIPLDILYRIERMFEFIMYSLKPDGMTPILGDQDNGRLLPYGGEPINDYRYLLSLGALLFNRPDFKECGNGFNIYCTMLGGSALKTKWDKISETKVDLDSKAFSDAGVFICRGNDSYLLFNATGQGMYPELRSGGHTHSDLLSFELFTLGKTFLVDPGSYLYTADPSMRFLFKSTRMHNTVVVDDVSQHEINREILWDFKSVARPEVIKWESNASMDFLKTQHNGYIRLTNPVVHERTLVFDKIVNKWIFNDYFYGEGHHLFEWFFHFDTGLDFIIKDYEIETNCLDGKNIIIRFAPSSGLVFKKEFSYVSKSYGCRDNGSVLIASCRALVPLSIKFEIIQLISL